MAGDERAEAGEREDAAGMTRPLASASVASILAFRHHPGRTHRDPSEERFEKPTIIFTTSGAWRIEAAIGAVDATPDTVVFGLQGCEYRVRHDTAEPNDTALCVVLASGAILSGDDAAGPVGPILGTRLGAPRTPAIARIQSALVRESVAGLPAGRLMIDGLTMELIAELTRAVAERVPDAGPARAAPDSSTRDRVVAARAYLDDHLAEDVDLAALGRQVALSPFHLARCFRREFGVGPHAYLANARLERGAELLAGTRLPVTAIAHRVGWRSPSHFAGRFRRRFGMPPGAYRRLAAGT